VATKRIELIGVTGLPEITPGDDLTRLFLDACRRENVSIVDGDVVVFTQKIVSKAEGCVVRLSDVEPSMLAHTIAERGEGGSKPTCGKDPRLVELALREARRIVRMDHGVLITETRHGFVCANSGVDASNVGADDVATTLPRDPDSSAQRLRDAIGVATEKRVGVIISDTFGRPWREGVVNVAIGIAGLSALCDYRGQVDNDGRSLTSTVIAVADELAGAAELVMGKLERIPVAVVRGFDLVPGADGARALVRDAARDLFR
jgi:coenzyme F420-0:L-glutamate ligase/coenzyme F420-1:gamma-L-glutamate ligase